MMEVSPINTQRLIWGDRVFHGLTAASATTTAGLVFSAAGTLITGSYSALSQHGLNLFKAGWEPAAGLFGGLGPMLGTLETAALAMMVAVPLALGVSAFQTEVLSSQRLRQVFAVTVDTLAAVPSVVYGLIGVTWVVPFLHKYIDPLLVSAFKDWPILSEVFSGPVTGGGNTLSAATVLALMILPTMAAASRVGSSLVPKEKRAAARALGLTDWEIFKKVVLKESLPAQVGAGTLALGRALGETMAVLFLIGNVQQVSTSLLAGNSTITTTIATELQAIIDDPMHKSALMALALTLGGISFLTSFANNRLVHWLKHRHERAHGTAQGGYIVAAKESVREKIRSVLGWTDPLAVNETFTKEARNARMEERYKANLSWRRFKNGFMKSMFTAAAAVTFASSAAIFSAIIAKGWGGLSFDLFRETTPGIGEQGGGLLNAYIGSAMTVGPAIVASTLLGIGTATYIMEYARDTRIGRWAGRALQTANDTLLGLPTLLNGLLVYTLMVLPMGDSSALAGSVALATIATPIITANTIRSLGQLPQEFRDAARCLALPKSKIIKKVLYRAIRPAVITGVLLALARVAGETAPMLFTGGDNPFVASGFFDSTATLPTAIYKLANNFTAEQENLAWSGVLSLAALAAAAQITGQCITAPFREFSVNQAPNRLIHRARQKMLQLRYGI